MFIDITTDGYLLKIANCTEAELSINGISPEILEAINNNLYVTSLDLGDIRLGAEGARTIAEALKTNTNLKNLDLGNNGIGAEGARTIAEVLKTNTTLTSLNLVDSEIGDETGRIIAEAIERNKLSTLIRKAIIYGFIPGDLPPTLPILSSINNVRAHCENQLSLAGFTNGFSGKTNEEIIEISRNLGLNLNIMVTKLHIINGEYKQLMEIIDKEERIPHQVVNMLFEKLTLGLALLTDQDMEIAHRGEQKRNNRQWIG